jgi:hypothetical protein
MRIEGDYVIANGELDLRLFNVTIDGDQERYNPWGGDWLDTVDGGRDGVQYNYMWPGEVRRPIKNCTPQVLAAAGFDSGENAHFL